MTFEASIDLLIRAVESVGAAIMVLGGAVALLASVPRLLRAESRAGAYERLRRTLGRSILLGLEVLIVADIINTILVNQTLESVFVLGAVVIIRVLLSFTLEVEIDGYWPWTRWKATKTMPGPKPQ
ncbi:MAG: DUF1622 domain-containing protein [Cryobacterium sp.]